MRVDYERNGRQYVAECTIDRDGSRTYWGEVDVTPDPTDRPARETEGHDTGQTGYMLVEVKDGVRDDVDGPFASRDEAWKEITHYVLDCNDAMQHEFDPDDEKDELSPELWIIPNGDNSGENYVRQSDGATLKIEKRSIAI